MPPIDVQQTPADNVPEDFTLESLKASSLTEAEVNALMGGDDPLTDSAPEPEAEAPPAAAVPPVVQAPPPVVEAPKPVQIPDTTQAEATIAKVDADLEALTAKYDEGELTRAEFLEQQRVLAQKGAAAQVQIETAQQIANTHAEQRKATFATLLDQYKAQGNDLLWSPEHINGWDAALRAVTGNQAYVNLPLDRQIQLAHDMYAANHKAVTGQAIPGSKTAQAEPDAQAPGRRTDPRPEPVQTLAGFNGDSNAAMDDGTFAAIDRRMMTDPLGAEKMLMRLPQDQQDAFLSRV